VLERRLIPLFLTTFVMTTGYGSIYTLLAVIRKQYALSEVGIGLIGSAGFLAGFVAQVALSRFADRGHTRRLLQVGLLCAVAGNLGMVLATNLLEFVASRALLGLGAGAFAPAVRRLVITLDPARAGERLGLMASFDMAGFITGPIVASLLYQAAGLRATFVALALALVVLLVPVMRTPIDDRRPDSDHDRPLRVLLGLPTIRGVLLCSLAFYITVGIFEAIWAVFLDDRGASQLYIGATLTLFSLPMLVIPPFAGRLGQERGPLGIAAVSIGFAIPCMLLYGWLTGLTALAVLVFVHACADAVTMPTLQVAVARSSPPEFLASGQGLIGAAGQLAAALTALATGWVYGAWGAPTLFVGGAALMTGLLAIGLWQGRELTAPRSM
jgi:DHA1 family multidrug resistance protein-like MFS transporter